MATEKFFVFNEAGVLKRLKGRIVRFLDNEDPDNDDKVAIRSSLSVPASAEGLTPANNLSDVSSVSTSRANLSVNSITENAEATGTKVAGPYINLDGSNDYIEVADSDALSFTDSTDDLPFSGAAWVKFDSAASTFVFAKWGTSAANREYALYISATNDIRLELTDTSGNAVYRDSDTVLTGYDGQWVHLAWTYGGAGPNSESALTAAADVITLYVNGAAVASTAFNNASYGGMTNTSQAAWIGRYSSSYGQANIRGVKLFNRELSASEVSDVMNGDLGLSDEWGGVHGGVYLSDHSAGTELSSSARLTASAPETIGVTSNTLKLTQDDAQSSTKVASKALSMTVGKRYRIAFEYFNPSGNSQVQRFRAYIGSSINAINGTRIFDEVPTDDAWTRFVYEGILTASGGYLVFSLHDGTSESYTATNGTDYVALKNISVTEIGTVADFRAEDFNESAGKLLDRSTNNFVGVNNGATLAGNQRHISADTIDLKNLPTSSAGLSAGEVWSNSGVLTVVT